MNNVNLKHGARVYQLDDKRLLVKQTIKRGNNANDEYVIDEQKEHHVNIDNDQEIANSIREAIAGKLKTEKKG